MDNQEKLATLCTQDTGRKQTKQKHNRENYNSQMLDITTCITISIKLKAKQYKKNNNKNNKNTNTY